MESVRQETALTWSRSMLFAQMTGTEISLMIASVFTGIGVVISAIFSGLAARAALKAKDLGAENAEAIVGVHKMVDGQRTAKQTENDELRRLIMESMAEGRSVPVKDVVAVDKATAAKVAESVAEAGKPEAGKAATLAATPGEPTRVIIEQPHEKAVPVEVKKEVIVDAVKDAVKDSSIPKPPRPAH